MKDCANINNSQSYSYSHLNKGVDYQERFSSLPGRKMMWEQEKELLTRLVQTLDIPKEYYLDFASGTGRILAHVGPYFETAYAIDISTQMLAVAQEKYPVAKFVNTDFREDPDLLQTKEFNLITAFRFFPNAEQQLRDDAMHYISRHLQTGGYLIANNHRTYNSTSYCAFRLIRKISNDVGMHHWEMLQLADNYLLKLVGFYSYGIIPQTERFAILPWTLMRIIEKANFRFGATKHHLGYNTIYLFQK